MEEKKSFLGTGWAFPPTFIKESKDVKMLSDENDVKNSLEILLSTSLGERVLNPTYGCRLSALAFETLDTGMITQIVEIINDAVLIHEPRVIVDEVTLENTNNDGVVNININYTISATNSSYNLVYPFYVSEEQINISHE